MRFRPCIDLHGGRVKQIVGSTLRDDDPAGLRENFVSDRPPSYYAALFRRDGLTGGHVIMLGPGNEAAARDALAAWPGGLQVGGGITAANAAGWLEAGAAAVIVTSFVFQDGRIRADRLEALVSAVGRERLVLDLSCRRRGNDYIIVTDRWQRFTEVAISPDSLGYLAGFCAEFLVHAADVEGKCRGVDLELVRRLADFSPIPATYAGGASSLEDLHRVKEAGRGRVDLTIGSALDIYGGSGVRYADAVAFNRREAAGG
ncbi:phosphoribosylformimino-5-aminoimidazole carboxamide ribotide isomerase [Dissulfurirhabdus thermomarina]|uniref:Phosphoribosylformimino-5-aminoimidazole carboxamide ribotide isomerase n=1 Tax=Dissulfurirhabdus thermomarina TaxID=1765737 RepID=A0A6N9TU93_DISTH|nr:phosphoribosylformimino-5-aminoimidazole carboxamide ribotide isomerase [Dissulfurirhabdus thermomarina]NDY43304.1 phosphoribosylformimino-5-aminoimidazole carboxamide ribotide isomerase [Dissulfurirhabdus thermomarina]NMX22785.1 phosphoribosylformimino-5-aminoimidazole carboxamide ribotide isomerase [Dissulfurirhabdus thermomarina]